MATYKVCDSSGNVITRDLADIHIPITGSISPSCHISVDVYNSFVLWRFVQEVDGSFIRWTIETRVRDEFADRKTGLVNTVPQIVAPQFSVDGSFFSISGGYLELWCDYGGSGWFNGVPDGVPDTTAEYYWYFPAGQEITLTASCPYGTATAIGVPAPRRWEDSMSVEIRAHGLDSSIYYNYDGTPIANPSYADLSVDVTSLGLISSNIDLSKSFTDFTGTCSASVQGGMLNAKSLPVFYNEEIPPDTHESRAEASYYPAIPVSLPYVILTHAGDYPDSLTVSAVLGGGDLATPQTLSAAAGKFTASQERYFAQVEAYTENKTEQKNTYGTVSLSITPESLLAQGEDYVAPGYGVDTTPRLTRLPIRAASFPVINIVHDASYALPDWANLANWSGSGGATVTQGTGGSIVITTGSNPGGATLAYPVDPANANIRNGVSALSYRFLNFTTPTGSPSVFFNVTIPPCSVYIDPNDPPAPFIPDAPGSIGPPEDVYSGLETPSKKWDVAASLTGLQGCNGDIDLCAPDCVAFGSDSFAHLQDVPGIVDGSVPLDRGTRWPTPSRMMPCQGVWRIEKIIINDIPANSVLVISNLTLRRRNAPTYDCLEQWNRGRHVVTSDSDFMVPDWESGQTWAASSGDGGETHTSHYERRGVLSIVDGKQAIEEAVFWYSYFQGHENSYDLFEQESIASLVARINARDGKFGIRRYPGVTATSLCPASSSGVYTYTDIVPCLNSDVAPAAWLCNHKTSTGSVTDESTGASILSARPLFDHIIPCAHLDWSQFEAIAVLRGTVQGLLIPVSDDSGPVAGFPVKLVEDDDVPPGSSYSSRGTSETSVCGFFSTGLPCGRAPNIAHSLRSPGSTPPLNEPFTASNWRARYRHRAIVLGEDKLCCTTLLGRPNTFFPFTPQFSDANSVPAEEWRRIGGATGFGEAVDSIEIPDATTGTSSSDGETMHQEI